MPVRIFFLVGALLSLGACRPQDIASLKKASPSAATQAATSRGATGAAPSLMVSGADLPPAPIEPSADVRETMEGTLETTIPSAESLTITILYDNNDYDERLKSAWGFAALVEYRDQCLLFDTGGDGQILMDNMRILGIDPTRIERVVLSHAHGDHTGGLSALLEYGVRPTVYLPPSFSESFKRQVNRVATVVEVAPGQVVAPGIVSTGEMGAGIPEQSLIIHTDRGLVIVTGCAHPGIVEIVEQARALSDDPVRLALGGFHLGGKSEAEIDAILADLRRLGVEEVAPCHCTGESAIAMFAAEYGENFTPAGIGKVIVMDDSEGDSR